MTDAPGAIRCRGILRVSAIGRDGAGVRVAVIDSGVHAAHPHVQEVSRGIGIDAEGRERPDFVDRLGHGTAVTAAIREKAPGAEILAVKVFDRQLAATGVALVAAIDWVIAQHARLINLSLGTANPDHAPALVSVVERATAAGAVVIAAAPEPAVHWLPGGLPGVVSVALDWTLPRDSGRVEVAHDGAVRLWASGYPRPIPGVPPDRNLKGLSFAVANATGLLARVLSGTEAHLASAIAAVLAGESGTEPSS